MAALAFEAASLLSGQMLDNELTERGHLPLDVCFRYATELATELREMHAHGRTHGSVDTTHVLVRKSELDLLEPQHRAFSDPITDVRGFGSVLYKMLTGKAPAGESFRLLPANPSVVQGLAAIRASATRLAVLCLAADRDTAPDFQRILTELRLLSFRANQFSPEQLGLHVPAPFPPVSYPPPQPLEAFAGKAQPVIDPPGFPVAVVAAPALPAIAPAHDTYRPDVYGSAARRSKRSQSRPLLNNVPCPKCKVFQVRLSRPRTAFERFLSLIGIDAHRCHRCYYRYVPFLGRKIGRKSR